jgi:hypothetical protein
MPQKPRLRPQMSQAGVVKKVASVGPGSVSTTLSMRRAPTSASMPLSFSWASSHMLRHAMTVTTGLPSSRRAASGCFRKAVTGCDGARNHTWYGRMTRSKSSSPVSESGASGGGFRWADSGKASKNAMNGQGNGNGASGRSTSSCTWIDGSARSGATICSATLVELPGLGVADHQDALGTWGKAAGAEGLGELEVTGWANVSRAVECKPSIRHATKRICHWSCRAAAPMADPFTDAGASIAESLALRPGHGPSLLLAGDVARAAGDFAQALRHHERDRGAEPGREEPCCSPWSQ